MRIFDRWASGYDRSILQKLLFEPVHDAVLSAHGAAGGPPRDVLDVGCGTGRLLTAAARRWNDARLVGIDASEPMIAEARRKHRGDDRFTFEHGDAAALPLGSASCDAAFTTLSFHHWQDQGAGIREIARVLRPGGVLVLADLDMPLLSVMGPLASWLDHATFRGPEEIQRILERAGLSVVTRRRFRRLAPTQLFVARKKASPSDAPS